MAGRHVLRISLVLALAMGVQAAHGAPARAAGVLRALRCCTTKCHRTLPAAGARQCCQVAPSDTDTAARAPVPQTASAALTCSPIATVTLQVPALASTGETPLGLFARAAPVFLLTRSLRL